MANLDGVAELTAQLNALGQKLGLQALRGAVRSAVRPVLMQMRAAAPVGTEVHRTYRGRLVAPGFLNRSLRVITKVDRVSGVVSAVIGTRKEAWYGVRLYDQGPKTITHRRIKATGSGRVIRRGRAVQKAKRAIKPYTLRRVPFFESVFVSNRGAMAAEFARNLRRQVEKRSGK